jgi:hypothetical protein
MTTTPEETVRVPLWLQGVRYGVPGLMFLTGLLILMIDSDSQRGVDVGLMFIGMAIAVYLMGLFFRIGVDGEKDRDAEDAARTFFDEHGYWPDEAEGVAGSQVAGSRVPGS